MKVDNPKRANVRALMKEKLNELESSNKQLLEVVCIEHRTIPFLLSSRNFRNCCTCARIVTSL
jgi:hypothetical protein